MGRTPSLIAALGAVCLALLAAAGGSALQRDGGRGTLSNDAIAELWRQLGDPDPGRAYLAFDPLLARPEQTAAFLGKQLRPASMDEAEKVAPLVRRLIEQLNDERYAVRVKAFARLRDVGFAAKPALEEALRKPPTLEVGLRLKQLLDRLAPAAQARENVRHWRALAVLEHLGTGEGRRLLRKLAGGTPDHWQTQEAWAALRRLAPRRDFPPLLEKPKLLATLRGHTGDARGVAFHPDGKLLASGGWDGIVRLWDLEENREIDRWHAGERVHSVAFSPDGRILMVAAQPGGVKLREVLTGRDLRAPPAEERFTVTRAVFHPAGRSFACTGDRYVKLCDVFDGSLTVLPVKHRGAVRDVAFSPNGEMLASAAIHDDEVRIWRLDPRGGSETLAAGKRPHRSVAYEHIARIALSDASVFATGGPGSRAVRAWDLGTGKTRQAVPPHSSYLCSLALHPGGTILATGAEDARARLWDTATGKQLAELRGHRGFVTDVAFGPHGRLLATASSDGGIRLWQVGTVRRAE
jgi:hypothetical protein